MNEPTFENQYDGSYRVSQLCTSGCGITTEATVTSAAVFAWRQGAFAQDAFPELSADEREALFISGICSTCWNYLFPGSDIEVEAFVCVYCWQPVSHKGIDDRGRSTCDEFGPNPNQQHDFYLT